MKAFIALEFEKLLANFKTMAADPGLSDNIVGAVELCVESLRAGGKVMFAGNGGSAADAQHWAGELVSRFYYDRPGLPAIALTTDTSILTAISQFNASILTLREQADTDAPHLSAKIDSDVSYAYGRIAELAATDGFEIDLAQMVTPDWMTADVDDFALQGQTPDELND